MVHFIPVLNRIIGKKARLRELPTTYNFMSRVVCFGYLKMIEEDYRPTIVYFTVIRFGSVSALHPNSS